MKKLYSWMVITLCLSLLTAAVCADTSTDYSTADVLTLFTGLSGDVTFSLPGALTLTHDYDYEGFWRDSRQLMGNCLDDGAEFQFRSADIAEGIETTREGLLKQMPEATETHVRLNALMNYIMYLPFYYGAEIQSTEPHASKSSDRVWLTITFTYPDTPGSTYYCKALLSGTQATGIVIEECSHSQTILDSLYFADEEELTALKTELTELEETDYFGLILRLPHRHSVAEMSNQTLLAAFLPDWATVNVQYIPAALDINVGEDQLRDFLMNAAKKAIVPFKTEQMIDPAVSLPVLGMAQLDFWTIDESTFGEHGPRKLVRIYIGDRGCWYLMADDTDDARSMLDSARFTETDSISATQDTEPSTDFPHFKENMEKLFGDFRMIWTRPVCTDGEWISVGMPQEMDIGGVLVYLDNSSEEALIREIRCVAYNQLDQNGLFLAEACAKALTGEDITLNTPEAKEALLNLGNAQITTQHFDVEGSSLVYDRIRIVPTVVPDKKEEIRFPEGEDIIELKNSVNAAQFDERLTRMQGQVLPDGYEVRLLQKDQTADGYRRIYLMGMSTVIMVWLDGDTDDSIVELIVIQDIMNDAPAVLGGTMLCYGAVTDQSEEENAAMSYLLIESPMWNQLVDRWPLLARDDVVAFLQETGETEDDWAPLGFISGRP